MIVQMRPSVSFGLPAMEIVSVKTILRQLLKPLTIYNILCTYVNQLDLLETEKVKRHLNIL